MSLDAVLVAVLAVVALVLGASGRVSLDAVGILLLVTLAAIRVVPANESLAGFGNSTVIVLASLYVIGEGLTRTGALEFLARGVLRASGGGELRLLTAMCCSAALMSAFVSDTAVVLVFLPIAVKLAGDRAIPASRLLLPVAYSALFGGMLTLVGSSINILTSSAASDLGAPPIEMFDLTPIALPVAAGGVLLTIVLTHFCLRRPESLTDLLQRVPAREYVAELQIRAGSPLVGQPVADLLRGAPVRIPYLVRDDEMTWAPGDEQVLAAGDVVMLQGSSDTLVTLQDRWDPNQGGVTVRPHELHYFEAAVSPRSHLVGRCLGELRLQSDLGVVPLAVMRDGRHIRDRLQHLTLLPGDLLLLCGEEEAQDRIRVSNDFFLISSSASLVVHRRLAARALGVLVALLAVFLMGSVWRSLSIPLPLATLLAALAMVGLGCVRARRAYRSIDWSILVFVVGALALGKAMEKSGLASVVARTAVQPLQELGPLAVLSGLFLVATVLNQLTSPYAVVALMIPIALQAAAQVGIDDPRPFILATALAGSNAFATPMGHQVNLMVMGPGNYRYRDYLILGIPLCLYTWLAVTLVFSVRGSF